MKPAVACLALATIATLVTGPAAPAAAAPAACPTPTAIPSDAPAPVPPVDPAALAKTIGGLPAPDATAAIVRVGGGGSWQGVTGVADIATRRPASARVRFRAGSVTKMFTTAVVLQLVAEGRLSLDDTVQGRLPGLLPAGYPEIRVGQLLNHTSGLPTPDHPDGLEWVYQTRFRTWTPREFVAEAVRNPIEFRPGTRQHYLNINTFVAGLLIEKITGRSYEHEVTTRILRPLGMRDTYLPGVSPRIRGPHHQGYQTVPAGFPDAVPYQGGHVVNMTEMSVTSTWASGDLISTAADLETFIRALFRGKVVPKARLAPMFTVPAVPMYDPSGGCGAGPAVYTSGMARMELPNGVVVYGKTGARYGYAAGVGATRDLSRTLVYSVNSTDAKASGQNERTLRIALAAFS
ncbi:peptidase [Sphaerisporangium rufum]|uniref:Peptidase n=1 Tax=Sphaerisporangium rufum TaxID=1381558 RepID=A0A919R4G1_9ACTN|nr:serine hydrolase domain-containing protein [Sphaerisporangium rufum]GII79509.1 peptidase [Sphaerisporangium rufum]